MTAPTTLAPAADLEHHLGDPRRDEVPSSFAGSVDSDEQGEMNWPALTALREWGMPAMLVPEANGGRLRSVEDLLGLFRVISRRDIRLTVAYGSTLLGAMPVWLWGNDEQRRLVAYRIMAGDLGSCALSEREHGSDLSAGECRASRNDGEFLLTGRKWPIGNATRGTFCSTLVRTGASAFSFLLLDKGSLPAERWENLPAVPTLGLRGHDLSGLEFHGCPVPASAVVGQEGGGLAQVVKTLQVTRTVIAGLSLGTLDTALRLALAHARQRQLYSEPVYELPVLRDALVKAYLDLLIGECVAVTAARGFSVAPQRLSLWSAIAKYLVPELAGQALTSLSTVLSAQYYIGETLAARIFQKAERDHAVVGIFDGTSHINLSTIAGQLVHSVSSAGSTGNAALGLASIFSRATQLPPWTPEGNRLSVAMNGQDEVVAGWAAARAQIAGTPGEPMRVELIAALDAWEAIRSRYSAEVHQIAKERHGRHLPVRAFTLARTHCLFFAAATCVHTWMHNRGPAFSNDWLLLSLQRLLQHAGDDRELSAAPSVERCMLDQADGNLLFSLGQVPLGA